MVLTSREFTGCLLSEPSRYTDTCIIIIIILTIILVIIIIVIIIQVIVITITLIITTVIIQMPFSLIRDTVYQDPSSLIT